MNTFRIAISSEEGSETIERVESFVGADESGSFGILADHEPFVTALGWGLCRIRRIDQNVGYLALPGGVLSFENNVLSIATPRYLRQSDSASILQLLDERMRAEESARRATRAMLRNLDRELLRRLLREAPASR